MGKTSSLKVKWLSWILPGVRFSLANLEDFSNPFYVSTFLLIETETWYRIKGIIVRLCFTHSIKFSNMATVCDLTYRILNCIWRYLICERKRALYSIKCVLRIFWQTWLHILIAKFFLTHCKHVLCNTLTHSTNEHLLNIKRKGDPEVSYPLSYYRYHWNPEPVCNESHFVSLFYLYWYFLIY